jgi:membrane protein YdbS with pleckstrin-like domain
MRESPVHRDDPSTRALNAEGATDVLARPALLPADIIHDDEVIILLMRPSLWFIPLGSLAALMTIAIVTLIFALIASKFTRYLGVADTHILALGTCIGMLRLFWQALEWINQIYVLTDRRVIRRSGVLRVSVFETPLTNIQHTSVFQRLRERVFGLGSIGFATSGSDVFDAFWYTIREPFAVHKTVLETIQRYGRRNH